MPQVLTVSKATVVTWTGTWRFSIDLISYSHCILIFRYTRVILTMSDLGLRSVDESEPIFIMLGKNGR